MLISLTVVIISLCICISNRHVVHLKYIQCLKIKLQKHLGTNIIRNAQHFYQLET